MPGMSITSSVQTRGRDGGDIVIATAARKVSESQNGAAVETTDSARLRATAHKDGVRLSPSACRRPVTE